MLGSGMLPDKASLRFNMLNSTFQLSLRCDAPLRGRRYVLPELSASLEPVTVLSAPSIQGCNRDEGQKRPEAHVQVMQICQKRWQSVRVMQSKCSGVLPNQHVLVHVSLTVEPLSHLWLLKQQQHTMVDNEPHCCGRHVADRIHIYSQLPSLGDGARRRARSCTGATIGMWQLVSCATCFQSIQLHAAQAEAGLPQPGKCAWHTHRGHQK